MFSADMCKIDRLTKLEMASHDLIWSDYLILPTLNKKFLLMQVDSFTIQIDPLRYSCTHTSEQSTSVFSFLLSTMHLAV